jgi:hypothetical protein
MRPKVRAHPCRLPPLPVPQPGAAAVCCRHAVLHRRLVRGLGCAFCASGILGRVVAPRLRPGPGSRRSAREKGCSAPSEAGAAAVRHGAAPPGCLQLRQARRALPAVTPCALRVKPPDMRGQPVAAASPPSTGWFRCGEPSQWHATPPRWLTLIGIHPLTRRYRCRRAQAARKEQDVGWEAIPLPNRPPGCRLGPGVAARG